jgi:translation initiation factor 3 subunit C
MVRLETTPHFVPNILPLEFDKLVRLIQRQHNVSEPVPPFYVRTLVGLETSLNTAVTKEKEAKKKMNATNAKALTAVKQKVKKAIKEYEQEVKKFQEVRQFMLCVQPRLISAIQDPEAFEREYTSVISPDAPAAVPGRRTHATSSDNEAIDDFTTVGKGGKVMQFTSEGIFKNLQAIQEARGKKVHKPTFTIQTLSHIPTYRIPTAPNKFVFSRNF